MAVSLLLKRFRVGNSAQGTNSLPSHGSVPVFLPKHLLGSLMNEFACAFTHIAQKFFHALVNFALLVIMLPYNPNPLTESLQRIL